MIKSLGHVGLGVSDMKRSLEFYRDFLGMKVLMELDITDDRIGRVIGTAGAQCGIVHLELGGTILELFQYRQPKGSNKAEQMQQYDQGLIHIGFEVDEFHELVDQLKARGTVFLGEPVEFRPDVWIVYVKGPDGEVVEFRQRPE
ncbi:MAG: VOC family protein [Sedimentisphaerales bacterium]|nr:VOC family protein [Sedimentisphaerales bacterium]